MRPADPICMWCALADAEVCQVRKWSADEGHSSEGGCGRRAEKLELTETDRQARCVQPQSR
jgi:hypothetical protein